MRARRLSQLGTADELGAATYFESAGLAELRGLVSTVKLLMCQTQRISTFKCMSLRAII